MKICLINHSFPPQIGGGETHLYLLAKGFAKRGHKVLVITGEGQVPIIDEGYKFTVERIKHFGDFEKGHVSFRSILDDLAKVLSKRDFDVVHVHNFMPGLAYASILPLVKTKKTIFTFHSTPIPQEGKIIGHFTKYDVEKSFASFILGLSFFDTLVCPSQYYYNWALRLGASKEKVKLVYHGVDEKDFLVKKDYSWRKKHGYFKEDFIIICPARMIYRKGILDLVKAVQIINNNKEKVKLYIPSSVQNGSAEYFSLVNDCIRSNNLSDVVKIAIDKESLKSMPQVYTNSNLCVLPSHIEGLGIVLLEAMAAGIPVIGSNTFGINEVIQDKVNGLLVRPKDPANLAEKILRVKNDSTLSAMMRGGGKDSVREKFSLTKQLDSLENIYKQ
ncbi:MAG: glycosyltransferase family 4 protein [Candidatus Moranbacteria bacterium]|nr:glycosyltransferase family 4 protein [Candidatus Moranbacteria bacterium]